MTTANDFREGDYVTVAGYPHGLVLTEIREMSVVAEDASPDSHGKYTFPRAMITDPESIEIHPTAKND